MKHKPPRGHPKRTISPREPRRIIRVLTEGSVTERDYLKILERQNPQIKIDLAESGMVPLTLVKRARRYTKQSKRAKHRTGTPDFDEIWCVFDVDDHPNVKQALQEARDSYIRTVISNPCFELWLLLHEQDQTAHIDRHDLQKKCQKLGLMDGKRIRSEAIPLFSEAIEAARRRAVALDELHEGNGSEPNSNPSTNAWEIAHTVLQLDA